mmetsp:Transcript_4987/g.13948  ORF Transcript_4987/g.13948 Transcript_4987/m.13948 type:complete len:101 (+) Transcript_4987:531-833(+)
MASNTSAWQCIAIRPERLPFRCGQKANQGQRDFVALNLCHEYLMHVELADQFDVKVSDVVSHALRTNTYKNGNQKQGTIKLLHHTPTTLCIWHPYRIGVH